MAEAPAKNEEDNDVFDKLSGTQKSAILMMLLGEDEASEILRNLSPKEVQHLGTAMYSVQGLDQDTVNKVLDDFLKIMKDRKNDVYNYSKQFITNYNVFQIRRRGYESIDFAF